MTVVFMLYINKKNKGNTKHQLIHTYLHTYMPPNFNVSGIILPKDLFRCGIQQNEGSKKKINSKTVAYF